MEAALLLMIVACAAGLYMAWAIGANDVANAMGTSVGSGTLTFKQAVIVAAIFEFAGAVIAGSSVSGTVRKGIVSPEVFADNPEHLVYGMMASLLAAAVWLNIASRKGWPVSTTHSIVGAIVGFTIVGIGVDAVQWGKIGQIAASWVVSPLVGGVIAYLLMISIRKLILDTEAPFLSAKRWGPAYVFLVGFVIALVTLFKGLKHLDLDLSVPMSFFWATVVGAIVAAIGWLMIRRVKVNEAADRDFHFASVEKVFTPMMLFTAAAMADHAKQLDRQDR